MAKYSGHSTVGNSLTELFWERWGDVLTEFRPDVIVPIPRHWTDRFWPGHELPLTIGATLSRFLMVPMHTHILRKVRRTRRQSALAATNRRRNLVGAFRLSRGVRLTRCRVVVVDDILTTGTTAHRLAQELKPLRCIRGCCVRHSPCHQLLR